MPITPLWAATPPTRTVHVNFEWRTLAEISYDRLCSNDEDARLINVRDLDSATPSDNCSAPLLTSVVPSTHVLRTQAFDRELEVYLRCYHFEFKGCCQRGPRCSFVHVVTLGDGSGPNRRRVKRDRDLKPSGAHYAVAVPSATNFTPPVCQPTEALPQMPSNAGGTKDLASHHRRATATTEVLPTPDRVLCPKSWWFRNPYALSGDVSMTPDPECEQQQHLEFSLAFSTSIDA